MRRYTQNGSEMYENLGLGKPRKKKTTYIKPELCQWIEEQIGKGEFWNFSHAAEVALEKLRDARKEEER